MGKDKGGGSEAVIKRDGRLIAGNPSRERPLANIALNSTVSHYDAHLSMGPHFMRLRPPRAPGFISPFSVD